ncbi:MAG TPA: hypothetical protein VLG11_03270 [Candidatus Saccharimonadales bacterium]|nr:hypothetical protein [Candidatus Saccharimonadales bacterium]
MMGIVSVEKQLPRLDPQQFSVNLLGHDIQEIDALLLAAHDELTERAKKADDGVAYYFAAHPETRNSFGSDMDTQPLKRCEEAFELLPEIIPIGELAPDFLRMALAGRSEREQRLSVESHCQGGYVIPEDRLLWRGLLNLGAASNDFRYSEDDVRGLAPRVPSTVWEGILSAPSMRYASLPGRALRAVNGIIYPANRIAHTYAPNSQLVAGYVRLQHEDEPLRQPAACVIPPDVAESFAQLPPALEL